jgi:hypothetical protein
MRSPSAHRPLPRPPPPPLAGTPKEQIKDHAPDPDGELVDADGEPIEVDELSTKDKAVHKSKSRIVSGFKNLSKRAAGFGGDVTVDGAKKKVSRLVGGLRRRGQAMGFDLSGCGEQIGSRVDRLLWGDKLKDDGSPDGEQQVA